MFAYPHVADNLLATQSLSAYRTQMESATIRILRNRRADLKTRRDDVRSKLVELDFEIEQIDAGIRAMEQDLLPAAGSNATLRSLAHHARAANPGMREQTMKQLVMRALGERFKNGASANELLSYFEAEWGRNDVTRTSLSPQLSRLKGEGKIVRTGKIWCLASNSTSIFDDILGGDVQNENGPDSGDAAGPDTGETDVQPSPLHRIDL